MNKNVQKKPVRNPKKGTERVQTKLGKTHVDYWRSRLRKRRYAGRDGLAVEVPDWQIRIKHLGRSMWFNLKTSNADIAAGQARDIYVFLVANGWEPTLAKYKPRSERSNDLSRDGFVDLYREMLEKVEYPPIKRSAERYIKSLIIICRALAIKRIARLTPEKIKQFRVKYLKQGREQGRVEASVKISYNSHLRNAAALFSKQMVEAYKSEGVDIANPFVGQKLRRIEMKPYTPMSRELLDSIWQDSVKLRDGEPGAAEPVKIPRGPKEKPPRWKTPDWRKPRPEACTILLLELGVGLRREESDKAQWDWFFSDASGRRFVEVKETPYFVPKSKHRRIIPVEASLWDVLHAARRGDSPFVVPGNIPKPYSPREGAKNIVYRCDRHHRALAAWLRSKGVNDDKPCHTLRKEFGSYVASSFGLFAAQRLLGHSSSVVTEAVYAGLVNLPELKHAQLKKHQ